MRNQPHSQWQIIDSAADRQEDAWNLDRQVELRTWLLWFIVLLVITLFGFRLYDLKANHQGDFLANAHPVTLRSEVVPAMDGRIYSSDGKLLAYDDQHFSLAVHYRWLEEPPNPGWLKQQARTWRKEHPEITDQDQAEQAVLEQREQLWSRLAELGDETPEQLLQKRKSLQKRIEQIAETVNERMTKRLEVNDVTVEQTTSIANWDSFLDTIKQELTQPPRRKSRDRIIIKEELDYHPMIERVSTRLIAEIESHPRLYPGVRILARSDRVYPAKDMAAHILGTRTPLRSDEIAERQATLEGNDPFAYQIGDRLGRSGIEREYESILRGLPGAKELKLDRRGEILAAETTRVSRPGSHLVLAMHSELQLAAEDWLDAVIPPEPRLLPPLPAGSSPSDEPVPKAGCLLVMNIYSGELIAAATAPRPDLSRMVLGESDYWKQLNSDPRSPLLSRMSQVTLAPGSTFKPVAAIALCETTGIPTEPFFCRGYLDTPASHRCAIFRSAGIGHNEIDLQTALAESCNVYFFDAARKLGPKAIPAWSEYLGFGTKTGIDLPFEKSGHVPSPADNEENSRYNWYPGDNLGLAIGQSYLSVTPLQMLVLTAAIANGGELITPRLLSRIIPGSETTSLTIPEVPMVAPRRLDISSNTLKEIQEGMLATVARPRGTGHTAAFVSEVSMAGKTGTAQTGLERPSHAWFIGYVPAKRPRYAFVIMLEEGGGGGKKAAPLARKTVQKMLQLQLIEPDQ